MSNLTLSQSVCCPYCWQNFDIIVDCSVEHQEYVEDCYVCCRPIVFSVQVQDEENIIVEAKAENE